VDTGVARFIAPTQTIPHRLHKTIGQGHRRLGTGPRHNAARPDGPCCQLLTKNCLKVDALVGGFDRSYSFGNAIKDIPSSQLTWLKVFALQDRLAQSLRRKE
jgi:hypothetical protein